MMPSTARLSWIWPPFCFGIALVLSGVPWGSAAAQPHPTEFRKVYALLVVDTMGELGESPKIDGERIDRLLSGGLPPDRVEIRLITGKDVNAAGILNYCRSVKAGPNDALFFYYAGHGGTDPSKGQFLAIHDLHAKPLLRSELRAAMQARQPGLIVIMTDCCSNRFSIPGKLRRVYVDTGTAKTIDPVLRCLLYQARGVVDITAATDSESVGDDHDGGLFTRSFDAVAREGVASLDTDHDGFVTWHEFFAKVQKRTESTFLTWAKHERSLGTEIEQDSQTPHAYSLGSPGQSTAVKLRNEMSQTLPYTYRWSSGTSWQSAEIAPRQAAEHAPPAGRANRGSLTLEVRFKDGSRSDLHPGKVYIFRDKSP